MPKTTRRLDPLTEAKIRRRCEEDAAVHRSARPDASRLALDKWYWVRIGYWNPEENPPEHALTLLDAIDRATGQRPRYHPAKVLEVTGPETVVVGYADIGLTENVNAERITRRLNPRELSDHLRREPVSRVWPEPGTAPAG